ncbi:MAG: DNA topoisomerase IV subunit A, partial [Spirochaetales bacterium]|nr:DNA topoisomerase IV subunit A [Spirochaetales bacterium]
PVQRRIIHTLFEMDDGKFHKVANVVGWAMRYHPHGDSSIYEALVNLANFDLFIERQGNFGNALTGDSAAAARYIECRLLPFAKRVLYNPELTEFIDSYDGRNKEPVAFPAKIPVVLIQGVSGIAVGMRTDILPHNAIEVLDAMSAVLKGETFTLYPDFPGGGIIDVEDYDDGRGSVSVRAKLNTKDPKRIIIEELPFDVTSEMMINSIEDAAKKGRLKISSINDYTAEKVNIEINLARNTYSKEIVDALYAYTRCETKLSLEPLVIADNTPTVIGVSDILRWHAKHLVDVLKAELELERGHLLDRLHARTLERIFIEERIYKKIENKKSAADVTKAVYSGLKPFVEHLIRAVDDDDVERLLKIPIRRISLFDIEKNKEEIEEINAKIAEIDAKLANLVGYALSYIDELKGMLGVEARKRKSTIKTFELVDVKEVAERNLAVRYDSSNGYLGYGIKTGTVQLEASQFDRLLVIRRDGTYQIIDAPEREFVGKGMLYCGFADRELLKDVTFTVIYQEKTYKYLFLKRCQILSWQLKKAYPLLPKGNFKMVKLSTLPNAELTINYKKKPGLRILEEKVYFSDYLTKGVKAQGVRLAVKEVSSLRLRAVKEIVRSADEQPSLFEEE